MQYLVKTTWYKKIKNKYEISLYIYKLTGNHLNQTKNCTQEGHKNF